MKTLTLVALLCLTHTAASFAAAPGGPAPELGAPLRVGGDVTKPEKLAGDPPAYTAEAREARVQGTVILEAIISESGDVTDVRVLKGLPMGLSEAAVKAVESWKFQPAIKDGQPVRVYYTLTVNFQIGPADDPLTLLQNVAQARAEWPEPPAPDAPQIAAVVKDVTEGRSTLTAAAAWAKSYEGESRSALLVWIGGEAWRQASARPPAADDSERASLVGIGIAAEDGAIANEGPNAQTWTVAEAKAFKNLLLRMEAEQLTDPLARERVMKESVQVLGEGVRTYNAVSSAAARSHRDPAKPVGP